MEDLVDKAMKDGAWGLATGLIYNPGTYAKTDEIIALAKVAAKHGGSTPATSATRAAACSTPSRRRSRIGREAGCRVHISHIKASGKAAWGNVRPTPSA